MAEPRRGERLATRKLRAASLAIATGLALAAPAFGAERLVIEKTNTFRSTQALNPLAESPELAQAAHLFAGFMARSGKYGHMADGREPAERAAAQGYDYCIVAENIARVYRSRGYDAASLAHDLVEGWKNSPEHRKSMLDPAVTQTGVGIAQDEQGRYFGVQMFGRPQAQAIRFSVRNSAGERIHYRAGERQFSLPPRAERTHAVCRPVDLVVDLPTPFSARITAGASYVIEARGGALSVKRANGG
jgi:hypothetical protein